MGKAVSMAPNSDDVRRKLEHAKRNLEQLKSEEEARKRRIALRKEREEHLRRQRKKAALWWLKPLLWASVIFAGLIVIAWYWPQVHRLISSM